MYSKQTDFPRFIADLEQYIKENAIHISEDGYTFLNTLIENPDMVRLMKIWLLNNNKAQLNYLLLKTLPALSAMQPEIQESALIHMFDKAKLLNDLIPSPSDLDIVLESMGEQNANRWDGWADFNQPLFACTDQEISKLSMYAFFINNGIFTANMVLAMNSVETAEFDKRIDQIIKTNADFIYPDRIFSDKLIKLIKADKNIQVLLHGIHLRQIEDVDIIHEMNNDIEQNSNDDLAYYLGIEDTDSDYDWEEQKQSSPVSDLSLSAGDKESSVSRASSNTTVVPTFWQLFNIQMFQLQQLIRYGQLSLSDIPDRELTQEEINIYYFMNKLLQDLVEPLPQNKQTNDVQSIQSQKSSPTASFQDEIAAKRTHVSSQQGPKKEFYAGIKQPTHNVRIQRHIRDEKRVQEERLNREPKGTPNWHKQYMKSLREQEKKSQPEEKTSNVNDIRPTRGNKR